MDFAFWNGQGEATDNLLLRDGDAQVADGQSVHFSGTEA
jgi:hypothetical protein